MFGVNDAFQNIIICTLSVGFETPTGEFYVFRTVRLADEVNVVVVRYIQALFKQILPSVLQPLLLCEAHQHAYLVLQEAFSAVFIGFAEAIVVRNSPLSIRLPSDFITRT